MKEIGKKLIYITCEKEIWLIDSDDGEEKRIQFEKNMGCTSLGKSKYVMLYSKECTMLQEGNEYIIGEIIIGKNEEGFQPLSLIEVMEAIDEFATRIEYVYFDGKPVQAYCV